MITAVIGAGGKTSLIHSLKDEYLSKGKKVFVTTTTHMYKEDDTLLTDDPEVIIKKLTETGYAMAGISEGSKITSLSEATYKEVCKFADEVLVEADGAKHFPLKIPNKNEPVIPDNVDKIIVVFGMHSLGLSAASAVFRLDTAEDSFGITPDTRITPEIIEKLIQKGYLEKLMNTFPDKEIVLKAAGTKTLYERACGALIEAKMDINLIDEGWFKAKPTLIICGAGHVSTKLAEIAHMIDMQTIVIDPRTEWANKERYPHSQIINDELSSVNKYLIPGAYYAVITPGHKDDELCVEQILNTDYSYLGMIGSHMKVNKTKSNLLDKGFSEEKVASLHAPIGLSIGAQTPAEIAVSIMAEIIQIKNKKPNSSASEELLSTDKSGMLCIIIDKTGSSPRGIGSMMLVTENEVIDTIGGGSIEHEAIMTARVNHSAFIKDYSLNNEAAENIGMICGGKNKILFLPV